MKHLIWACAIIVATVLGMHAADTGSWQKRTWKSIPGELTPDLAAATLPTERPLVCCLLVTDNRGLSVSSRHVEIPTK